MSKQSPPHELPFHFFGAGNLHCLQRGVLQCTSSRVMNGERNSSRMPLRKSGLFRGILLAGILLGVSLPMCPSQMSGQSSGAEKPGPLILPRPVDKEYRALLKRPAPRSAEVILAEIDALPKQMATFQDDPATWIRTKLQNRELRRHRIDLISELEEAGYKGQRLQGLLEQKLEDINAICNRNEWDAYNSLRTEIIERHPGEPIAVKAETDELLDIILFMNTNKMHVAPQDYERISEVEFARKEEPLAGLLLLEALHLEPDPAVKTKWHDWMMSNLGTGTMGHGFVLQKRSFGKPIRLEGVGFEGEKIDTGQWKGDVVLVDFWGTWCQPCMEALPELKQIYEKYQQRGLRIVGVLCDQKIDKAKALLREKGYEWTEMVDRSLTAENYYHPIARKYAVGAFPTFWIIDRQGVLRVRAAAETLEKQILQYLEEPSPDSNLK
ncbi:MAG: TlpA family protein disulfide reductase [Acidobacteriia bacterium]|nr:TlpA family protein disulfide reductase [Terriglobia bacterium]